MMKSVGVIGTAALFLFVGFAVPAEARQEKQEEKAGPPRQEQQARPGKQQQAKPQQQQQHAQQQAKGQQVQQRQQQQQAKSNKQQEQHAQQQARGQQQQQQDKSAKQGQRQQAKGQQQQHGQRQTASSRAPQRTQQAIARQRAQPALRLSARGNGRIPDDRFRSNFGRGHSFRMGNPVMVDGYSRFQYGGYWFGFAQPWPVGWYYTDDFYIDYMDGGYYMYDPYFPGARFAITVVL